jgi:hypothetical protein
MMVALGMVGHTGHPHGVWWGRVQHTSYVAGLNKQLILKLEDRLLSIAYGRPITIPRFQVKFVEDSARRGLLISKSGTPFCTGLRFIEMGDPIA